MELLRLALRNAPLFLSVYDREFNFKLLAGGALAGRGLKEDQLVGVNAREMLKDNPDIMETLDKTKLGLTTRWYGIRGGVHMESYPTPLYDAEGRFDAMVSMALDVTERVKAEEEVRRLNADLENRIRERARELEEAIRELEAFSYSSGWTPSSPTCSPSPGQAGDPSLVRQVMANLVSNAVKFTRGRDPARIEIGSRPGSTFHFSLPSPGEAA